MWVQETTTAASIYACTHNCSGNTKTEYLHCIKTCRPVCYVNDRYSGQWINKEMRLKF
jgi:hypothetical protein